MYGKPNEIGKHNSMNKYGQTAVKAVQLLQLKHTCSVKVQ